LEDRKRGIDAIISRSYDPALHKELEARKQKLSGEMTYEINKLETEFITAEARKTREI